MEFQILSRKDAVRYCKQEHKEKSIIISICDSSEFFQKLSKTSTNGVKDILYLSFDDIEDINFDSHRYLKKDEGFIIDNFTGCSYKVISKEDANRIVDFINIWYDKVDRIIVHCVAGISRSSGTCAAIKKAMTGNDNDIFKNPRYVPNMTCYKTVLSCFAERGFLTLDKLKSS